MSFSLIKLQLKLWTKGDKMLYFYLISLIAFITFYILSYELLWKIFITLSNIYLAILYNRDSALTTFYRILNINFFKIHAAKISIIYLLSLLQLITFILLNKEGSLPIIFITHFLTFYTALLFYNFPNWVKLLCFMFTFLATSILLSITPLYATALTILALDTLVLKNIINGKLFKESHFI